MLSDELMRNFCKKIPVFEDYDTKSTLEAQASVERLEIQTLE